MPITSALILDSQGALAGIPASSAPQVTALDNGGFAMIAESLNQSILVVYDSEGNVSWSKAFEGISPSVIESNFGTLIVQTQTDPDTNGDLIHTELDLTGTVLQVTNVSFGTIRLAPVTYRLFRHIDHRRLWHRS